MIKKVITVTKILLNGNKINFICNINNIFNGIIQYFKDKKNNKQKSINALSEKL